MATTEAYLQFVLEQLSELEDIRFLKMMNEYVIYYKEKVIGGIYDNRFLIKQCDAILSHIKNPQYELPYPSGKPMILLDIDDRKFLKKIIEAIYIELPLPKPKKPR